MKNIISSYIRNTLAIRDSFNGNKSRRPSVFLLGNPTYMDEFNALPLHDKRKYLWDKGRYVMTTDFYGARVKLFSLKASFVEVYYHPVEKKVMRISVAGEQELKKHLSRINLTL